MPNQSAAMIRNTPNIAKTSHDITKTHPNTAQTRSDIAMSRADMACICKGAVYARNDTLRVQMFSTCIFVIFRYSSDANRCQTNVRAMSDQVFFFSPRSCRFWISESARSLRRAVRYPTKRRAGRSLHTRMSCDVTVRQAYITATFVRVRQCKESQIGARSVAKILKIAGNATGPGLLPKGL